jgi:hypothetical protein
LLPEAPPPFTVLQEASKDTEKISTRGSTTANSSDSSDQAEEENTNLSFAFKVEGLSRGIGEAIPSIRQSYRYYRLIVLIPIAYLLVLACVYFLDVGGAIARAWISFCRNSSIWLKAFLILAGCYAPLHRLLSLAFNVWSFRSARNEPHQPMELKHVVVVPAYKEPIAVLIRTLQSLPLITLDVESGLETAVHVVMAFEKKDEEHAATFQTLQEHFENCFASLTMTVHSQVCNERPGKGSNENYALRQVMAEALFEGEDPWRIMVTICDADSVFAPGFFQALELSYRSQLDGRRLIYSAPRNTYRNVGRLCNPLIWMAECSMNQSDLNENITGPYASYSNYSMLLGFCGELDFWDPEVIPEDFHMVYKAMMCSRGAATVARVWSVISNDMVTSMGDRYVQAKRHNWGVTNIAWILAIFKHAPFSLDRLWYKLLEAYAAEISDSLTPRAFLYVVLGLSVYLNPPAYTDSLVEAVWVFSMVMLARLALFWFVFFLTEAYVWRCLMSTLGDAVDRPGWCQLMWLYGFSPVVRPLSGLIFGTLACWDAMLTAFWSSEFEYVTAPKE